MIELDDEGIALSCSATVADGEACPNEHQSLVYRAGAPQFSSVDTFLAKKEKASSSVMTTERQSRKVMTGRE